MAGRFNIKFAIILVAVLLALTGAGAVGYFVLTKSSSQHVRLGDEHMQAGLLKRARASYGKAVGKDPNNIEALLKLSDVISQIPVSIGVKSSQAVSRMYGILNAILNIEPDHPQAFQKVVDIQMKRGLELGSSSAWDGIFSLTDKALAINPKMIRARQYRGISQVMRSIHKLDITEDKWLQAKEDLEATIQSQKQAVEATYYLALWHVLEAQSLTTQPQSPARDKKIEQHRQSAVQWVTDVAEEDADHLIAQLYQIDILLRVKQIQKASRVVQSVEAQFGDQVRSRREATYLIGLIGLLEFNEKRDLPDADRLTVFAKRILKISSLASKNAPDDMHLKLLYARHLRASGQIEQATKLLEEIRNTNVKNPPLETEIQFYAVINAMLLKTELDIARAFTLEVDQRSTALENIKQLLDDLQSYNVTSASYHYSKGQYYILLEQWHDAAQALELANDQYQSQNPRVLIKLSQAMDRAGQGGRSVKLLEQALQLKQGVNSALRISLHQVLVKKLIKYKKYIKAQEHLSRLKALKADADQVADLQMNLFVATKQYDKVHAYLDAKNPGGDIAVFLQKARVYMIQGKPQQAKAMLLARHQKEPALISVLKLLCNLGKDKEEILGYLQEATEAGAQDPWIDQVLGRLTSGVSTRDIYEEKIANLEDPISRLRYQYNIHKQYGETDKAAALLEQAHELDGKHPWVVSTLFEQALAARNWEDAERYAHIASIADMDYAQGRFYRGRIAHVKGQFEVAIVEYREGLSKYKNYSNGWLLLGEVQFKAGKATDAIESYNTALSLTPDNIEALLGVAKAYQQREDSDKALDHIRQAYAFEPNNVRVLSTLINFEQRYGDKARALSLLESWVEAEPHRKANKRQLARIYDQQGKKQQATELLEQVTSRQDADMSDWDALARHYAFHGEYMRGENILIEHVVSDDRQSQMNSWLTIARYRLDAGHLPEALQAYEYAATFEDEVARPATRQLAQVLLRLNKKEQALAQFKRAYESDSGDKLLSQTYVELLIALERLDEAALVLDMLGQHHGADTSTYMLEALLAYKRKQIDVALEKLDAAASLTPQRAGIYLMRAEIYGSMTGREDAAIRELNRVIELNPKNTQARLLLVSMLLRTNDLRRAVGELQGVLQRQPNSDRARHQLVSLYVQQKQYDQATRLLEQSIELAPKNMRWGVLAAQVAQMRGQPKQAAQRIAKLFPAIPKKQEQLQKELLEKWLSYLWQAKLNQQALALVDKHRALVTSSASLTAMEALVRVASGDEKAGIDLYGKAVAMCKTRTQVSVAARYMAAGLGQRKTSEQLNQIAKQMIDGAGEDQAVANLLIVLARYEMADHSYTQAIEHLQWVIQKIDQDDPDLLAIEYMLSLSYHQNQQYEQAKQVYLRMLESDPNHRDALNNLAYMLSENLHQPDEALIYAQQAYALQPNNIEILDTLGWIQYRIGALEDAYRSLRKSVDSRFTHANGYHLATVLAERSKPGDKDEALELAKKSLTLSKQRKDKQTHQLAQALVTKLQDELGVQ